MGDWKENGRYLKRICFDGCDLRLSYYRVDVFNDSGEYETSILEFKHDDMEHLSFKFIKESFDNIEKIQNLKTSLKIAMDALEFTIKESGTSCNYNKRARDAKTKIKEIMNNK